MYKARIEDWHGDEWEDQPNSTGPRDAAEECVERYIARAAHYSVIDGDPVAVEVRYPDGTVMVWNVQASSTVHYYARQAPNVLAEGREAGLPAERPSRSDCSASAPEKGD